MFGAHTKLAPWCVTGAVALLCCEGSTAGQGSRDPAARDATAGESAAADGSRFVGDDAAAPAADTGPTFKVGETPVTGPGGILEVEILDPAGQQTAARVNVIGADHAYYEPAQAVNPLFEFSHQRFGNRRDKGPARYVGAYFYTDGRFQLHLPPGPVRIEVDKGYAYYPAVAETDIVAGRKTAGAVTLNRLVDMARAGWYATETTMGFGSRQPGDARDIAVLKVLAGADLNFSQNLSATVTRAQPQQSQIANPQYGGHGPKTIRSWQEAAIISGHCHVAYTIGPVLELMTADLPAASRPGKPIQSGPSDATIYDQTVMLGGVMGHTIGGYDLEILSDVVLRKTDWVELLVFGYYNGIGTEKYYQVLNAGFRFPLRSGSDFPFCRNVGDVRTYVMGGSKPSFESVVGGMLRGESFATSGPLLFLSVEGSGRTVGPGNQLEFPTTGAHELKVKMLAVSSSAPLRELELVVSGRVVASETVAEPTLAPLVKETTVTVTGSSWIVARVHGPHDARAHTNPVWIYMNGKPPFDAAAASAIQRSIQGFSPANVDEDVTRALASARAAIAGVVAARANEMHPIPNFPRGSTVGPGTTGASLLPDVLPRPDPLPVTTMGGRIIDETGAPVANATVAARGTSPSAQTDSAGRFSLPGLGGEDPLFLRASKTAHMTTNTPYLNRRCDGPCLTIVLLTDAAADALTHGREPKLTPEERKQRAWIALNVFDARGVLKGGVTPGFGAASGADDNGLTIDRSRWGAWGFVGVDGQFGGMATAAKPKGGIQAVASSLIEFAGGGAANPVDRADVDNSVEPNHIITVEELGKSLVLPVFTGEMSYASVVEGLQ